MVEARSEKKRLRFRAFSCGGTDYFSPDGFLKHTLTRNAEACGCGL